MDKSGKLRPILMGGQWYVMGEGFMIPVDDEDQAKREIKKMKPFMYRYKKSNERGERRGRRASGGGKGGVKKGVGGS